ncbi:MULTISPECIES: hypothetical protein [unclassified Neorhizobium]|uniref:hypothetical protein n=1 Tax=unclassified Neorhizobium TaxID=2629175 RepID=UPI001FF242E4|nr:MULTISPECIES: hypothetical protein [unclassified Neorhizobium]MCJ9670429.1 hypothetical protein [Neorhizobium sp. SHOUNA12B]MCJ9745592.1 hypothetical protein [Neorhizobium sp. SHOUNA12A]
MSVNFLRAFLAVVAMVAVSIATPVQAASYKELVSQGYKTGKLTRGPSGAQGWILSKDKTREFCLMTATSAYVGKAGMVAFTSAGRQVKIDRKVFESHAGSAGPLPQLEDLNAGRPSPDDVGVCRPVK